MNDFPPDEDNVIVDAVVVSKVPNDAAIEKLQTTIQGQVASLTIVDQPSYSIAESILVHIKRMRKEIDAEYDDMIEATNKAHKLAVSKKKRWETPAAELETQVKNKMGTFLADQKKIKEEEARKAWVADQEKLRLQQEARQKELETKRKAEEERLKAEEEARIKIRQAEMLSSKATNEADRIKAEARTMQIKIEAEAKAREAHARIEAVQARIRQDAAEREAAIILSVAPPAPVIETSGSSLREDWTWEIIAEAEIPRTFLMVDEKKLGKYARAMKEDAAVAGVRFFPKPGVNQRLK